MFRATMEAPMADGSATIALATQLIANPRLADGVGHERHLVARCAAPLCRRCSPCDPSPWFAEGLGELPLRTFSARLRCVSGSRQAEIEIQPGPFVPVAHPDLYIFR
jgi:hypothetical protein